VFSGTLNPTQSINQFSLQFLLQSFLLQLGRQVCMMWENNCTFQPLLTEFHQQFKDIATV